MAGLRYKDLNWDTAWSKYKLWPSKSESLVFKVEDVKPDSPHLIGKGVFDPTVRGHQPELTEPWVDLTLEGARLVPGREKLLYMWASRNRQKLGDPRDL